MSGAEAALSKSLDDIIAEQRKKKGDIDQKKRVRVDRGGRGERREGPAPREGVAGGGGGGGRRPRGGGDRAPRNLTITIRGGVQKAGRGAPRNPAVDRQAPEQRLAALEGGARWGHDMYDPRQAGGVLDGPRKPNPRAPTSLGTKLYVSNLDYSVSDDDIKELFGSVGKLVRAGVVYDASGRSEGEAEIIFERAEDAERAMERYNNVQLDGQPMQIELIPQGAPGVGGGGGGGPRTLRSGIRVSGERGGSRVVGASRSFQQALGGATRNARGRGSTRGGGTAAMDME